jgi:hypothetical protein
MNRRLFRKAFEPFLRQSRFLRHADGRYPYLPWWLNSPIILCTSAWRMTAKAIRLHGGRNDGPWGDWKKIVKSESWRQEASRAEMNTKLLPEISYAISKGALRAKSLDIIQQANLLQVSYLAREMAAPGETCPGLYVPPEPPG